jgi:hypothetical protein
MFLYLPIFLFYLPISFWLFGASFQKLFGRLLKGCWDPVDPGMGDFAALPVLKVSKGWNEVR